MNNTTSVRILEIMASKICHDLISPVGAVANGVEILEEMGPDAGEDVSQLIAYSAAQANAKLKALRLAYGMGGADSSIIAEDVHKIFGEYIAGEARVQQKWDPHADIGLQPQAGFAKTLISALILATEALPKGGVISVTADGEDTTLITGEGENAHFRDGYLNALAGKTLETELEPQQAHAYITGLLMKNYGFDIKVDETENNFIFLRIKKADVS